MGEAIESTSEIPSAGQDTEHSKRAERKKRPPLSHHVCVLVTQSCPTLCDPMDCSLPGSSVHGILQARILEWVATPFSRESSRQGAQQFLAMNQANGWFLQGIQ